MGDGPGTEKSRKYDRQLRIWGENGQAALEAANICLINGGCLGCEILKNLVLPGIGSVTIVDGNKVEASDLGNNFFVTADSIGESRAKVTAELLQELNEDVAGNKFVEEDPEELISKNPAFFDSFTVVIATQLPEASLQELGRRCWANGVALVIAKLYGFLGYSRVVLPELCIVESKPDNALEDLRIPDPFPELVEICDSIDIDIEDSTQHCHTPWLVILYKCLQEWRQNTGTDRPVAYAEKKKFKELINGHRRGMEENYDEAIEKSLYA
jgi:amyloid beta precursor protein binding protein 1